MISRPTNTSTPPHPHPSSLENGLLQSIMETILCVLWMQWGSNLSDSVPLSEQMADRAQYLWLSFPFKEKSSLSLSLCGYLLKTATDSNGWARHFSTKTAMAEQGTSQQKWMNRALHDNNGWTGHFKTAMDEQGTSQQQWMKRALQDTGTKDSNGWTGHFKTLAQKTAMDEQGTSRHWRKRQQWMNRALQDTGAKDSNGWTGHFTTAMDEQGTSHQQRMNRALQDSGAKDWEASSKPVITRFRMRQSQVRPCQDWQPDDRASTTSTAHYTTTPGVSSGQWTLWWQSSFLAAWWQSIYHKHSPLHDNPRRQFWPMDTDGKAAFWLPARPAVHNSLCAENWNFQLGDWKCRENGGIHKVLTCHAGALLWNKATTMIWWVCVCTSLLVRKGSSPPPPNYIKKNGGGGGALRHKEKRKPDTWQQLHWPLCLL